jgi:uncharacterized protein YcaQ
MPVELWPVMQHRMEATARAAVGRVAADQPGLSTGARQCATRGLDGPRPRRRGAARKVDWGWNWSETRKALDYLFLSGDLAIARSQRAVRAGLRRARAGAPRSVLGRPRPARARPPRSSSAGRRSHGVATVRCLRDYYRSSSSGEGTTRAGRGRRARRGRRAAAGHDREVGMRSGVPAPRIAALAAQRSDAGALLSPFDPVVMGARAHRAPPSTFTTAIRRSTWPEADGQFGYYVLPFMLGDAIDGSCGPEGRSEGWKLCSSRRPYAEPGAPPEDGRGAGRELRDLASWLNAGPHRRGSEPKGRPGTRTSRRSLPQLTAEPFGWLKGRRSRVSRNLPLPDALCSLSAKDGGPRPLPIFRWARLAAPLVTWDTLASSLVGGRRLTSQAYITACRRSSCSDHAPCSHRRSRDGRLVRFGWGREGGRPPPLTAAPTDLGTLGGIETAEPLQ